MFKTPEKDASAKDAISAALNDAKDDLQEILAKIISNEVCSRDVKSRRLLHRLHKV